MIELQRKAGRFLGYCLVSLILGVVIVWFTPPGWTKAFSLPFLFIGLFYFVRYLWIDAQVTMAPFQRTEKIIELRFIARLGYAVIVLLAVHAGIRKVMGQDVGWTLIFLAITTPFVVIFDLVVRRFENTDSGEGQSSE